MPRQLPLHLRIVGSYERMASKGRAPLYPDDILWNFEKFLVGRWKSAATILTGYDA
jgi:glutathione peroxidase-family protein